MSARGASRPRVRFCFSREVGITLRPRASLRPHRTAPPGGLCLCWPRLGTRRPRRVARPHAPRAPQPPLFQNKAPPARGPCCHSAPSGRPPSLSAPRRLRPLAASGRPLFQPPHHRVSGAPKGRELESPGQRPGNLPRVRPSPERAKQPNGIALLATLTTHPTHVIATRAAPQKNTQTRVFPFPGNNLPSSVS